MFLLVNFIVCLWKKCFIYISSPPSTLNGICIVMNCVNYNENDCCVLWICLSVVFSSKAAVVESPAEKKKAKVVPVSPSKAAASPKPAILSKSPKVTKAAANGTPG